MTFAHPPDRPCDATCDHPRSGDATEALARALQEALAKDEWYALLPGDAAVAANRIRRRLRAKGYEVRPIADDPLYAAVAPESGAAALIEQAAESCRHDAQWIEQFTDWVIRAHNQQAAEAADREAAGVVGGMESHDRRELTSAAADLDVEALAEALNVHAVWHAEALPCNDRCAGALAAAYAAALEAAK